MPGVKCGTLNFGDKIFVAFLKGRKMPNGMLHTGWVLVDDFCGDGMDDSYCFQPGSVAKTTVPNVDLYLGDFTKTGMMPMGDSCDGPAGNGSEPTQVYSGDPGSMFIKDYGGSAIGTGKCGDRQSARDQQYGPPKGAPFGDGANVEGTLTACWGYDGQVSTAADCADCQPGITCAK
jgi:hypothetical protein